MTDLTVNVSKTISAPIETVFDAWLNPDVLANFMLPMPGMEKPEVTNEAKEGGGFSIAMKVGDNVIPHTGQYLTLDRPNKLAFSWISPESVDDSVVTLDFRKVDDNTTHIELTHVKFIDEERRSNHEGGWTQIIDVLAEVVGK